MFVGLCRCQMCLVMYKVTRRLATCNKSLVVNTPTLAFKHIPSSSRKTFSFEYSHVFPNPFTANATISTAAGTCFLNDQPT